MKFEKTASLAEEKWLSLAAQREMTFKKLRGAQLMNAGEMHKEKHLAFMEEATAATSNTTLRNNRGQKQSKRKPK